MISGLLTQKATSPIPAAGQIKPFAWEERTSKAGNVYTKIKNETPEYGGKPCKIIKAEQTDFRDPHGNVIFNIEIEPTEAPELKKNEPGAPTDSSCDSKATGVDDARKHAMQAANLMLLAMEAGRWCFCAYQDKHKVDLPDAHFQSLCATLFIEMQRAGYVLKMPDKPL